MEVRKCLPEEYLARASMWLVAQLCLTLYNPMFCSPPGCSVHGILQARILEWVAISLSMGSSRTQVSHIAGRFLRRDLEEWCLTC